MGATHLLGNDIETDTYKQNVSSLSSGICPFPWSHNDLAHYKKIIPALSFLH
jgi:hypothetical protein